MYANTGAEHWTLWKEDRQSEDFKMYAENIDIQY